MKWFDKWFYKQAKKAWDNKDAYEEGISVPVSKYATSLSSKVIQADDLPDGGLNINVRAAHGGKIVMFRTYDNKTDRSKHTTYVIPDDQDFEKELGKIITLESMKVTH